MKTIDVLKDMYSTALDAPDQQERVRVLEMMIDLLDELADNSTYKHYLTVHEKNEIMEASYYYDIDKSIAIGDVVEMIFNDDIWQLGKFRKDEDDPDFDEFTFIRLRDMEQATVSAHDLSGIIKKNLTHP